MTDRSFDAAGFAWVAALGTEVWAEEGRPRARATIRPEMLAPGTRRLRLGVLATMVDVAGGTLPTGALNPTVDLRVQLLADAPSGGVVELYTTPVKHGRRLYVGEVTAHAGDDPEPFARSTITFLNQVMEGFTGFSRREPAPIPYASLDEAIGLRFLDERTAELDPAPGFRNGPGGTVQGGAQATVAEIVAEHALADRGAFAVVDLDIRYVGAMKAGPLVARAEVLAGRDDEPVVRVALVDGGADGRIVSLVVCGARRAGG